MTAATITGLRKGDGRLHLTVDGEATLCGRTPKPNNWAKVQQVDEDTTARYAEATVRRPYAMEGCCLSCMAKAGIEVHS